MVALVGQRLKSALNTCFSVSRCQLVKSFSFSELLQSLMILSTLTKPATTAGSANFYGRGDWL